MRSSRIIFSVIGISFFLVFSALLSFRDVEAKIGEEVKLVENEPLNITAETLTYYREENLFVAEGSVEITYRSAILTADRVEFNELTGDALAIGNVVYEEADESIVADQAEINFDNERGIIHRGELSLEDDHYITGTEIRKIAEKTYLVNRGTFTACKSPRPAWQFRGTTAKIHQGEYLQSWNTVGFVKGIPVFYFPYFIFPIKTERQTGFLVPDIGTSTSKGFTIGNAFFWAISDSQESALRHTFYEERGHKFDLEYRYKYRQGTGGRMEGEDIRDKLDLKKKRKLKWEHEHRLPYSIKARVKLTLASDDEFDKDFETRLEDRIRRELESEASLTKNFSRHTIRLSFDRLDDLREESGDRADQRFPEFSITSQKQQIWGLPLYFEQKTQIARLKKEEQEDRLEFSRFDFLPTLSLPLNLFGQALTVSPELQLRETYYTRDAVTAEDHDVDAKSTHREYYTATIRVDGPKFNRIFDLGTMRRVQKLKHLIEPNVSFQYRPGIDEEDIPKFDGVDRIGSPNKSRSASYGITQRLLSKHVKKRDWEKFLDDEDISIDELDTETKELASFTVNQSYNFEKDDHNFSDISATFKTTPFDNYDLTIRTTYDVYINTFVNTDIDLQGNLWDILNFGVKWRRSLSREDDEITDVNQFLDLNTRLTLFNSLGLSYRGRFNIEDNERIEDNIGLAYNAQCWNIIGNYTQQLVDDERDKRFQVIIELKHLGKLFDIKG